MRPRPGRYPRDLRTLSARPALAVRATWVLGVRTVHPTQFCDSALFRVIVWTLFKSTVHRVKKKRVQKF